MIPTLPVEVTCPQCRTKYQAQVRSVIDVGQEPALKEALLRGQLNAVTCPSCGALGVVTTPVIYHDPSHELLLLFVPTNLNMAPTERERLTGSLINALMATVPAEQRKGYFFQPRTFLTMESLIEEVLQADGITKEMIEEQRARSDLLRRLVAVMDDAQARQVLIEQNRSRIDYSFLLMLNATAEASAARGQEALAEKLLDLQSSLAQQFSIVLPEPLPLDTPRDKAVQALTSIADQQARWAFVAFNRPLLDYAFFQELTSLIERSVSPEVERLIELRSQVLEMVEQLDKEAREIQSVKLQILREALESPDARQYLKEHVRELDTAFLSVLAATLRNAQESHDEPQVERLLQMNELVMATLQEGLPPQLRLVNQLLSASYPDGTRQILQDRRGDWDASLLDLLQQLSAELAEQGRPQSAEHVDKILSQARAFVEPESERAG